jgi:hypothetical protein
MLTLFIKNRRVVQKTGMSFAVVGTTMHVFNVANMMTWTLSNAWSTIAIVGFVLTASSEVGVPLAERIPVRRRRRSSAGPVDNAGNDAVLS